MPFAPRAGVAQNLGYEVFRVLAPFEHFLAVRGRGQVNDAAGVGRRRNDFFRSLE